MHFNNKCQKLHLAVINCRREEWGGISKTAILQRKACKWYTGSKLNTMPPVSWFATQANASLGCVIRE